MRLPEVASFPEVWQCSNGEKNPSCRWHLLVVPALRAQYPAPAWPRHCPGAGRGQRDAVHQALSNTVELKMPLLIEGGLD